MFLIQSRRSPQPRGASLEGCHLPRRQSHGQTSLKDLADAQLREEFTEIEKRYNVVLELLGEKDEEIEDLKDNVVSLKELVNNLSLQNAESA